jgi:hypothetical protein
MRQELAILAQAETKSKAPFGNRNGRPDKFDCLDPPAKLKKDLTLAASLAQREIANLKNQTHQAKENIKENIAKERAERGSKSEKDDSPDEEVGSANKLSEPRHRGRKLHHRVRHRDW